MVVKKTTEYIGSMLAKKVLKNRPELHKKFDDIMKNDVDVTASTNSQTQQALKILRESDEYKELTSALSNLGKKNMGGEIVVEKGGDYIKDLL
tara:strand:- start:195 stop:473 length:279 start_codon:yes stop_codon:yes gene_type:complete